MILVQDILEANGKTVKENNMEQIHKIPLGALVEIGGEYDGLEEAGVRMFVVNHSRDCDGTPLYDLSFNKNFQSEFEEFERCVKAGEFEQDVNYGQGLKIFEKGRFAGQVSRHYGSDSLKVINLPKD